MGKIVFFKDRLVYRRNKLIREIYYSSDKWKKDIVVAEEGLDGSFKKRFVYHERHCYGHLVDEPKNEIDLAFKLEPHKLMNIQICESNLNAEKLLNNETSDSFKELLINYKGEVASLLLELIRAYLIHKDETLFLVKNELYQLALSKQYYKLENIKKNVIKDYILEHQEYIFHYNLNYKEIKTCIMNNLYPYNYGRYDELTKVFARYFILDEIKEEQVISSYNDLIMFMRKNGISAKELVDYIFKQRRDKNLDLSLKDILKDLPSDRNEYPYEFPTEDV